MNQELSIQSAATAVRKLWETHGIKQPLRFLGFCLSLLPVPIIPQIGQALDKHLSDQAFQREVDALWAHIESLNSTVGQVSTLELAIQEIAKTVSADQDTSARVRTFLSKLGGQATEFKVITEDNSYQQIVNSIITADLSLFSAHAGSTNVVIGTTVNSNSTTLLATKGSRNLVDNTKFQGSAGSVAMQKITTNGPIQVAGSSVGFGEGGSIGFGIGGSLGFGPSPFEVSATCPRCNASIKTDKRRLVGYTSVQCPNCKAVLPFDPRSIT